MTLKASLSRGLGALLGPVLSFERVGYAVRAATFDAEDLAVDLSGQRHVVTGANSGLGWVAARALARLGAQVVMVCRDPARGAAARERLMQETGNTSISLEICDVSELTQVRALAERLQGPIASLLHNAGALSDARALTSEGLEQTFACHVVGPVLLTLALRDKLVGGRVIFVASGGMYLSGLDLAELRRTAGPFDGVKQYARAKRAQVTLTPMLAERLPGVGVHAMHPGWADTPGVRSSLPRFYSVGRALLRSPEQGADTAVWLAAARSLPAPSGTFWADRTPQPTVLFPGTSVSEAERAELWGELQRWVGAQDPQISASE